MRIGIAIDVSTDLPDAFIAQHGIEVLPSTIHSGDASRLQDRDLARGLAFYREQLAEHGVDAWTTPLSVAEVEQLLLARFVLDYDYVFLVTLAASRSRTFENANKAAFTILQRSQQVRAEHGIKGPFALRVVDSESVFTGPGLLAWELVRAIRAGASSVDLRARLDTLVPQLHAYLVPRDLGFIRARALRRGDRSVSWFARLVGDALDLKPVLRMHRGETRAVARVRHFEGAVEALFSHAAQRLRTGLTLPVIGVSYGGDPQEIPALPGFAALARAAQDCGVEVMTAMMSPAAAVNVGAGGVSLAYCGDAGEFGT